MCWALLSHGIPQKALRRGILTEIEVLRNLRHQNVISLEGTYCTEGKIHISYEFVEGMDLFRLIPSKGFKEEQAKGIFYQLCAAVSYLHRNQVFWFFNSSVSDFSKGDPRQSETGNYFNSIEGQSVEID